MQSANRISMSVISSAIACSSVSPFRHRWHIDRDPDQVPEAVSPAHSVDGPALRREPQGEAAVPPRILGIVLQDLAPRKRGLYFGHRKLFREALVIRVQRNLIGLCCNLITEERSPVHCPLESRRCVTTCRSGVTTTLFRPRPASDAPRRRPPPLSARGLGREDVAPHPAHRLDGHA